MAASVKATEVHVFSPAHFVENIVVRSNGQLLLTTFEQSSLYALDPASSNSKPVLVTNAFPDVNALTGIAEIAPDVFAVAGGNAGEMFQFQGGWSIFTLSLASDDDRTPKLVARVPSTHEQGSFINGLTSLPEKPHIVLGAESRTGEIIRINTQTGQVDVIISDPNLRQDDTGRPTIPMGVNGVRAVGKHLYFANSGRGLFGRIPVSSDGDKLGDVEIIARFPGVTSYIAAYDDFAVTKDEAVAYIAAHPNQILRVDLKTGSQTVFFEGDDQVKVKAPTSAALARDEKSLFVTTWGIALVEGKLEHSGGQVIRLDVQ